MAEAGRPNDATPLAADDMIGSLATQVRQLSLRVAELEGQLEAARKRVAVYEDFDTQVQDSLSAALRAANQIRERARVSADAITQEARATRPAAAQELDAVRTERDALRRAIERASSSTPSRQQSGSSQQAFPMSEMRTAATEALRGVFKELVAEIRSLPAESAPARPANSPPPPVPQAVVQLPAAQPPATPAPPPPANVQQPRPQPAPAQPYSPPPSGYNVPPPEIAPHPTARPVIVPQQPAPPIVEDVDVAPNAAPPASAPAQIPGPVPEPAPHAVEAQREEWVTPSEPIGEVQVVLSPISSFPRLVELERRLQGMPAVRTVYARDFRNGVATLAIGLRNPMTVGEFAAAVTRLEYPRLRVVSTTGYVLELRIDSEASSIA